MALRRSNSCGRIRDPAIAQIPAIMLTGHGESEVLCLEAGADDFVIKPIKTAVLRARIETQLRLRSLRTQLQQQNEELEEWRQQSRARPGRGPLNPAIAHSAKAARNFEDGKSPLVIARSSKSAGTFTAGCE